MKILETLLNDDTNKKSSQVENNIHLNISPDMNPKAALSSIQGYQPPQVHLSPQNIVQYHAILPSPLPAPNLALPAFQQHQVNNNILGNNSNSIQLNFKWHECHLQILQNIVGRSCQPLYIKIFNHCFICLYTCTEFSESY